jgi:hypothetical protein
MMTDLDHQHSQLDIDMKILSVNVQPTTDTSLPAFDNTKLVAMNTCPTWGILRYTQHKTTKGTGRAMALEAGAAAHEVFAAHRLYYLLEYARDYYTEFNHEFIRTTIDSAGQRIFGQHRFGEMVASINQSEDFRTRCNQFALTALYNSGFYDDPRDKRRTTTNIEEMCIAYMDRMDFRDRLPVMFSNGFVGIEIPVDVTITIDYINDLGEDAQLVCRFIGKADGVHYTDKTKKLIRVHENKTAFRLGEAWERSWDTNHQPTGYMIALTAMLNKQITQSEMLGTTLPMPRNFSLDGISRVIATRYDYHFVEWFEWFLHTVNLHNQYEHNVITAPMYTHSCNRYFRPCSFIDLCALPPDERQQYIDEMETEEWSPLHE